MHAGAQAPDAGPAQRGGHAAPAAARARRHVAAQPRPGLGSDRCVSPGTSARAPGPLCRVQDSQGPDCGRLPHACRRCWWWQRRLGRRRVHEAGAGAAPAGRDGDPAAAGAQSTAWAGAAVDGGGGRGHAAAAVEVGAHARGAVGLEAASSSERARAVATGVRAPTDKLSCSAIKHCCPAPTHRCRRGHGSPRRPPAASARGTPGCCTPTASNRQPPNRPS